MSAGKYSWTNVIEFCMNIVIHTIQYSATCILHTTDACIQCGTGLGTTCLYLTEGIVVVHSKALSVLMASIRGPAFNLLALFFPLRWKCFFFPPWWQRQLWIKSAHGPSSPCAAHLFLSLLYQRSSWFSPASSPGEMQGTEPGAHLCPSPLLSYPFDSLSPYSPLLSTPLLPTLLLFSAPLLSSSSPHRCKTKQYNSLYTIWDKKVL